MPKIDLQIRRKRTKREVKSLEKLLHLGFNVPKVYNTDNQNFTIYMQYLEDTVQVKQFLKDLDPSEPTQVDRAKILFKNIGELVAKMHSNSLNHGDLTGSNILILPSSNASEL